MAPFSRRTRWHGTSQPTRFAAMAFATARTARGAPIDAATAPYVVVAPGGMRSRADHTATVRVDSLARWLKLPKRMPSLGARGVAVGTDGAIYVAESQAARLLKVAGDGLPLAAIEGPRATPDSPERFEEPFDVATSQFGWVYVLDPAAARLSVFDSNGALVRNLPTDPAIFDRSRGLTVADGGSIWIAQTPTGRIVQLSPSGDSVQELAVWPGEDSQPVDVALAPDGSIYVTDAGLFKLVRFAPDGRRLMAWDLPRFNSIDGSHLAIDGAGNVYVTLPDTGQVAVYDAAGQELGRLALPAGPQGAARPVGIGVDAYGTIWVSDVVNGRLVTLERN